MNSAIKSHETIAKDLRDRIVNLDKEHVEKIRIVQQEGWEKISTVEAEKLEVMPSQR